jgi:tRNA guanosine-2'-O-methyltransferase
MLTIADATLARTSAFKNLAASAHHWQPLTVCPPSELSDWTLHQKHTGYSAIALQPTPQAIPLPDFQFPKQALLILGRELTGIPPEIQILCDQTVVIPQAGLVESLNVQTAAAIAIYEYARQHRL